MTPSQLHQHLNQNPKQLLVILHGAIYDLTGFQEKHPGGVMALWACRGKDATDLFTVFHVHSSAPRMRSYLNSFYYGPLLKESVLLEEESLTSPQSPLLTPPDSPLSSSSLHLQPELLSVTSMANTGTATTTSTDLCSSPTEEQDDALSALALGQSVMKEELLRVDSALAEKVLDSIVDDTTTATTVSEMDPIEPMDQLSTSLDSEKLALEYRQLHEELLRLGCYEPDYWYYYRRALILTPMFITAVYLCVNNESSAWRMITSAIMLAIVWHQVSFVVHDAGHHSITLNRKRDDYIGILLASTLGGLSAGWWRSNHNYHHIMTNDPEHDPDIQHLPFLAVSERFFDNLYSFYYRRKLAFDWLARLFIPWQHYLYLVILSFGRFNLYAHSLRHQLTWDGRPDGREYRFLELGLMLCFWVWYSFMVSHLPSWPWLVAYVYLSHAATLVLHLQITLSHFGMSTEGDLPGERFLSKTLRTTMNISCPERLDFVHGGLQFQIEHHLFPRVPAARFRRQVMPVVREWCERRGLEYVSFGFIEGKQVVDQVLEEVAGQCSLLMRKGVAHGLGHGDAMKRKVE